MIRHGPKVTNLGALTIRGRKTFIPPSFEMSGLRGVFATYPYEQKRIVPATPAHKVYIQKKRPLTHPRRTYLGSYQVFREALK